MSVRRALVVTLPKPVIKESLQILFQQAQSIYLELWCFVTFPKDELKDVRCVTHARSSLAGRLDEILDLLEKEGVEEVVILTATTPKMDILWIERALEMVGVGKTVVRQGPDGGVVFLAARLPFSTRFCEPGGYKPKRGDHFITWLRWNGKDVVHLAPMRPQPFAIQTDRQAIKRIR